MPTRPEVATFDVDTSVFVHIDGQPGTEVTCLAGSLWVTQDGSATDVELEAGERHVLTGRARLIVCGFGPASLQVTHQRPATAWNALWRMPRHWVAVRRPAATDPAVVTA